MSELNDQLFAGAWMGDRKDDPPQVTVQAGLAAATGSVGEQEENPAPASGQEEDED